LPDASGTDCYLLRNEVVHEGHKPDDGEALAAKMATGAFTRWLGQSLTDDERLDGIKRFTAPPSAEAAVALRGGCRTNPSRKSHGASAQPDPRPAGAALGLRIAVGRIRLEAQFLKRREIGAHRLAEGLCDSLRAKLELVRRRDTT
jgi:hypothetical protein